MKRVELHMLQNFASSNLNRDDTGNPKDCVFGGHRRSRISSQCIKRCIRTHDTFTQTTGVERSSRTRYIMRLLCERLEGKGKPKEEAELVSLAFAQEFVGKIKDNKTSVLFYVTEQEQAHIVDALLADWDALLEELQAPKQEEEGKAEKKQGKAKGKKKKAGKDTALGLLSKSLTKELKSRASAPDIAMFGRMLADTPDLNIDAACQVAHAISTHRVSMEMDYFTAVDDLSQDDESGAGMLGFTSFNSSCFYRYAGIDMGQLATNLNGDTALCHKTVEGFLRAAVRAVPSGKQNAFAAQNPPSLVMVVVRQDGQSWSLANAFEKPVSQGSKEGIVEQSIKKLDAYWQKLCRVYGSEGVEPFVIMLDDEVSLDGLDTARRDSLDLMIKDVIAALSGE